MSSEGPNYRKLLTLYLIHKQAPESILSVLPHELLQRVGAESELLVDLSDDIVP